MTKLWRGAIGMLAAAGMALAADPALLQMVPPTASVVAGMQVDQGKRSAFGRYMLAKLGASGNKAKQLMAETGFDPRRDMTEVLFAAEAPAAGGGLTSGLILARGTFDPARIAAAVRAKGGVTTSFQGVDVLSGANAKQPWALAFLDNTTAIVGDVTSVKAAVTQHAAGTAPSADLTAKVALLSANNDFWFLTLAPMSSFAASMPDSGLGNAMQNGQMFQAITQASGGVHFGDNVVVTAEAVTRSDKDAQALVDVVHFLATMMQGNQQQDATAQQMAALLNLLVLKADANVMHLSLSVPESQLESFLDSATQRHLTPPPPSALKPVAPQAN